MLLSKIFMMLNLTAIGQSIGENRTIISQAIKTDLL
jgi:hypothetical protein